MASKEETLRRNNCFNSNHTNVRADIFRKAPFFDSRDIVQVKYEMVRAASNGEGSIAEISSAFGFSRKSYYQINEAYQSGGLYALIPKKKGPKGAHKLTAEAAAFISEFITNKPNAKPNEISNALESETGVNVHPRTIYRYLKKN